MAHGHGLSGSGCLIKHRGVGDGHPGQIADHRLEIHQSLHSTLRNLSLVGGVGRVPTGILKDVATDDGGKMGPVIPHANVIGSKLVLRGNQTKFSQSLLLGSCPGNVQGTSETDILRNSL